MIYDYNVWTDDLTLDVWFEDPAEALRLFINALLHEPERSAPHITRYPVRLNAQGEHVTLIHEDERIDWHMLLEDATT